MPTRLTRFLLWCFLGLLAAPAWAAPGDTTIVPVVQNMRITRHGAYDTLVALPHASTTYRQIRLHYVLGRYQCPAGSQYCGSWDYTTRVLMPQDSIELGRVITPYATDWALTRKHDYVLDVTDYAQLLTQGPKRLRYFYDGYSWGFTVSLYFEFIEGTPPHEVFRLQPIYEGGFNYGRTSDPIEQRLKPRTVYVPGGPPIDKVVLKTFATGHGSDDNYCSEFCTKYYEVLANGNLADQYSLWRADCGLNPVSPQTGTWVYDRANWCPGQAVAPRYHDLTPWAGPGTPLTVDVDMEAYTAPNQQNASAYLIWNAHVIQYGPPSFQRDADLLEIISPTTDPNYARDNPACAGAKIRLRNGGGDTLRTLPIRYRVGQGAWQTYQWTGALPFLAETVVTLPLPFSVLGSAAGTFEVEAQLPGDQNVWNDKLRSAFQPTVALPTRFAISFRTNNATQLGVNETSYELRDEAGTIVHQRTRLTNNTQYDDTLTLTPGCYVLKVTDRGCDGFAWWANPNAGNGFMRIQRADRRGNLRAVNGDFGCETTLRFRADATLGLTTADLPGTRLDVAPNPAPAGPLTLDFELPRPQDVTVHLYTADGRLVRRTLLRNVSVEARQLDLTGFAAGLYLLQAEGSAGARFWRRVAVQ